ncbi:hypothetical protein PSAC2689_170102 [Paraburkholderia sacchari]
MAPKPRRQARCARPSTRFFGVIMAPCSVMLIQGKKSAGRGFAGGRPTGRVVRHRACCRIAIFFSTLALVARNSRQMRVFPHAPALRFIFHFFRVLMAYRHCQPNGVRTANLFIVPKEQGVGP